jgi:hypothetical protein
MKLYHGSNVGIRQVDLTQCRPNKDFGRGFYTTHIKEQAIFWSRRIADRFGGQPIVTAFEFDYERAKAACGLKIKVFDNPDKEWALFVMGCRGGAEHDFDIVIGPVADDSMARLFALYEMNIIGIDSVVDGLTYKGLNSQYFFKTEQALQFLSILHDESR